MAVAPEAVRAPVGRACLALDRLAVVMVDDALLAVGAQTDCAG
jgi:hypothetical protein